MSDPDAAMAVPLKLELNYDHALGWAAPFHAALKEGRALASACPDCGRVWFPPRPVCDAHGVATEWREIPGDGQAIAVTQTRTRLPFTATSEETKFVLVRLDGVENAAFGRMRNADVEIEPGARVRLVVASVPLPHPAQAMIFTSEGDG